MSIKIQRIEYPELFFGIVAPVGGDLRQTIDHLQAKLESFDYTVATHKVTDVFKKFHKKLNLEVELKEDRVDKRLDSYIEYGDRLRAHFDDDSLLAYTSVFSIMRERERLKG